MSIRFKFGFDEFSIRPICIKIRTYYFNICAYRLNICTNLIRIDHKRIRRAVKLKVYFKKSRTKLLPTCIFISFPACIGVWYWNHSVQVAIQKQLKKEVGLNSAFGREIEHLASPVGCLIDWILFLFCHEQSICL